MSGVVRSLFVSLGLALALVAGCVGTDSVQCDGWTCPPGTTCGSGTLRCINPEQLTACQGLADYTPCTAPSIPTGQCIDQVCVPAGCGNSQLDPGEVCDDGNTAPRDGCSSDCRSNETCGNSIIDVSVGESCDDGNTTDGDGCQGNCQVPRCGDGIVDPTEKCDDGNRIQNDGCSSDCQSNETCPNGVIDPYKGEQCDDNNSTAGDGCGPTCKIEVCGNGVIDPGEVCDDGDTISGNGCSADCKSDETCGNGYVDIAKGEGCDDGGHVDGDGCQHNCVLPQCGDGVTDPGEACDDGGHVNGDGCNASCTSNETCRNGVVDTYKGEECDDNNAVVGDGCGLGCKIERCGNGVLDPGEVCDPLPGNTVSGDGCSADCKSNETCPNGYTDYAKGEQCDDGGSVAGDGCSPTCKIEICGNGIVDPGEACDPPPGNNISGDGCSGDCLSNETCGNGYPDYLAGELCDDGNNTSHDTCSGACQPESFTWSAGPAGSGYVIAPNAPGRLVFNSATAQMLMFGGTGQGTYSNELWSWNGQAWNHVAPVGGLPAPRSSTDVSFDAARKNVVMFGGFGGAFMNDTWLFDGARWLLQHPVNVPAERANHSMAYDAANKKVVLFGGSYGPSVYYNDLWTWNGTNWTKVLADGNSAGPSARYYSAMAYDAVHGQVVLFGGSNTAAPYGNDTWVWNGTSWTQKFPTTVPPGRWGHALSWDSVRKRIVMYGGYNSTGYLSDTYEWDGTNWLARVVAAPVGRRYVTMAYDQQRQKTVLYGGYGQLSNQPTGTYGYVDDPTWEWDGSAWTKAGTGSNLPVKRWDHAFAYDVARGKNIIYGGATDSTDIDTSTNTTWEWNGLTWTQVVVAQPTTPRADAGMAYDTIRRKSILFGGRDQSYVKLNDTWQYAGTWAQIFPATVPPARMGPAMAFDVQRGEVVMFGGLGISSPPLQDTYVWNGTNWFLRSPTTKPGVRYEAAMAYDASRQRIVLFGGTSDGTNNLNDTWEWDGTNWAPKTSTTTPPSARRGAAMAYDALTKRVFLFGGSTQNDTWSWDGTSWRQESSTQTPNPRTDHSFTYDVARRQLVLYSGVYGFGATPDGWLGRYEATSPEEACITGLDGDNDGLKGCADPDCGGYCDPFCTAFGQCTDATRPRCGDGACGVLENYRLCPADCPTPPNVCGDFVCDSGETISSCPGDCTP